MLRTVDLTRSEKRADLSAAHIATILSFGHVALGHTRCEGVASNSWIRRAEREVDMGDLWS